MQCSSDKSEPRLVTDTIARTAPDAEHCNLTAGLSRAMTVRHQIADHFGGNMFGKADPIRHRQLHFVPKTYKLPCVADYIRTLLCP